jgi:hypothetical protein
MHQRISFYAAGFLCWQLIASPVAALPVQHNKPQFNNKQTMNRKTLLGRFLQAGQLTLLLCLYPPPASAWTPIASLNHRSKSPLSVSTSSLPHTGSVVQTTETTKPIVLYHAMELPMKEFGVSIPVACWFPAADNNDESTSIGSTAEASVAYRHRISVRRIGQLLAGWDFIPEFVSKDYVLGPTSSSIAVQAVEESLSMQQQSGPVIFLAHGYLGSRFDLSHLAEELAAAGFTCIAPEYPESLAASYDRVPGLDRATINEVLLQHIREGGPRDFIKPTAFGIVGHSLGCGTVLQTGTEQWARVLIAGFPHTRDGVPIAGNNLLITSVNDGAVSMTKNGGTAVVAECNFQILSEGELLKAENQGQPLPRRAALIFDRSDAPNHISFLAEGVNDAMIEFLSPLLPLAQALSIPVLDFDKYKESRDSAVTAAVVHPLILRYLKQELASQSLN